MQLPINEDIRRNRGYASVLSAAFKAVSKNFKTVFRRLWPFALAYAVVAAFILVSGVHNSRIDVVATFEQPDAAYWTVFIVTLLLMFAASIALIGRTAMLMNGGGMRVNMLRSWSLHIFGIAVFIVVMACIAIAYTIIYNVQLNAVEEETSAYATGMMADTAPVMDVTPYILASSLITIIAGLLLLPYLYVGTKYLMAPVDGNERKRNRLPRLVFKAYGQGIRHWGYIFITVLLLGIIVAAVQFIVSIPMSILVVALGLAVSGTLSGDELGLPGYFYPMMYIVSVATYFILTAATVYSMFVMSYMYGSIETRIEEKRSLKEKAKDKDGAKQRAVWDKTEYV